MPSSATERPDLSHLSEYIRRSSDVFVREIFGNSQSYVAANVPSIVSPDLLEQFRKNYEIPSSYFLRVPGPNEPRWMRPSYSAEVDSQVVELGRYVGLPKEAFACGLRLHLHYFTERVVKSTGCGLGQLSPNCYTHIILL